MFECITQKAKLNRPRGDILHWDITQIFLAHGIWQLKKVNFNFQSNISKL